MAFKIELHFSVYDDVSNIADWYEQRQAFLSNRFLNELNLFFAKIETHPYSFHYYMDNIRIAVLKTFPYCIMYEIIESENLIAILAVIHSKRSPYFILKTIEQRV